MFYVTMGAIVLAINAFAFALIKCGKRDDIRNFRDVAEQIGEIEVKNIQPDMDFGKQTRKATAFVIKQLQAGESEKAMYAMNLMRSMLENIRIGQPQPWSMYLPMFQEEFDCV